MQDFFSIKNLGYTFVSFSSPQSLYNIQYDHMYWIFIQIFLWNSKQKRLSENYQPVNGTATKNVLPIFNSWFIFAQGVQDPDEHSNLKMDFL